VAILSFIPDRRVGRLRPPPRDDMDGRLQDWPYLIVNLHKHRAIRWRPAYTGQTEKRPKASVKADDLRLARG
jgi:hypothetical protein